MREQNPGLREDWVFPSSVGTLLATGSLRTPLRRALKVAGIQKRLTPHGLRRTLNTLALEVAPSEAVRKVLGHADAAMTERYLAPSMDAKRAVLGKVVTLVRGGDVGIAGGDRGAS